jgi:uncharacterized alkaline shock family protein YloU
MALSLGPRLPCGAELDALAEQVAAQAPPADPEHQARCPHCTAALDALGGALGDLETYGRAPVAVPPRLTARIMARVHQLADTLTENLVLVGPRGETRISHRIVAQVARRAALAVPGVLLASAQTVTGNPGDPGRVGMTLRLVIAFGPSVDALAGAVRARVGRVLPRVTGAEVSAVDVVVDDLRIDPDA